jgi:hypothetical protein
MCPPKECGEVLLGRTPGGRKDRWLSLEDGVYLRGVGQKEQQIQSERLFAHASADCHGELRNLSRTTPSAALNAETARVRHGDHQLWARSAQHDRVLNAEHVTGTRLDDLSA